MKICIPVEDKDGIEAKINAHFGSAPYFLIYDPETDTFGIIDNRDRDHMHGTCHPLQILEDSDIKAVVCKGMGMRAIKGLNRNGIKAYKADAATAKEIIQRYKEGALKEITISDACIDHSCH